MNQNKYYYDKQLKDLYYDRYEKMYNKIKLEKLDDNLSTLLSTNTKSYLIEKAKRLEIKGYSKLGKDELVKLIEKEITDNINAIINNLSYNEIKILSKLTNKDIQGCDFKIEDLTSLGSLASIGLIYRVKANENYMIVVHKIVEQNIRNISEEELRKIQERSKPLSYFDGIMNRYGLLPLAEVNNIIEKNQNTLFIDEDLDYYYDYIFRSYEVFKAANCFVHPYVFSPEDIYSEINARQNIKYDFDNIDEYIKLGEDFSGVHDELTKDFKEIIYSNNISKEDCEVLTSKLIFHIKNNLDIMMLMDLLNEKGILEKYEKDEEESKKLVASMSKIYNNTPMWIYKGLTSEEMEKRRTTIVRNENKIGRNDPCPCGSGKKYKKCCGK